MAERPDLDAIEEIMATAMAASRRRVVPAGPPPTSSPMPQIQVDGYIHATRECLAALDAAGLAVVPRRSTKEMRQAAREHEQSGFGNKYKVAVRAFDPTTWKPKT